MGLGVAVARGVCVGVTRQFEFGFLRQVQDEKHSPNALTMLSLSQQYCGLFDRHRSVMSIDVCVGRGVTTGVGDAVGTGVATEP